MIELMNFFVPNVAGDSGFALAKSYLGRGDSVVGADNLSDSGSCSREMKAARLAELGIRDALSMLSENRGGDGTFPAPSRFCGKFRFYLCGGSDSAAIRAILRRERCDAAADESSSDNDIIRLK